MSDSGKLTHYFVPAVLSLQRIQYIPGLFRGVTRLCLPAAVPVNSRLDSTSERDIDTAGEQRGKKSPIKQAGLQHPHYSVTERISD